MKVFAVFGDPVKHSLSPMMHNAAMLELGFNGVYHAFQVKSSDLRDAIYGAKAMGFGGVNLTVPHKEKALEFIRPDPLAAKIGAVNTIDFREGITGYNTDGIGALRTLLDSGIDIRNASVLIVGAGGAARAISFQLASEGAHITIANRTQERALKLAEEVNEVGRAKGAGLEDLKNLIKEADILINTTTVGMYPAVDDTIATADMMHPDLTVFDIVYNPLETKLLKEAKKAGSNAINGVMMLVYQGAEAFEIWTDIRPPVNIMKQAVLEGLGR
ncbi:shikimate 5-dehydrogenase [Methanosalsum zhilinae DSM 4017]|uniref:Shikimate dehydrogenase (NADP(+)) n=1 Tax=Methanosalsum zhilinae (strain DSM 4017 / NBRC 107636 / OCM 62 / WeN5) TaxID=679901 RepID=F7XNN8_METZD|nr:shikimate dehydrogenase [Methanosalsum zhilinae]AEH60142.1 shikimate 5-dehydrogenase [Methanosalsum zhilinae DSM 4017]